MPINIPYRVTYRQIGTRSNASSNDTMDVTQDRIWVRISPGEQTSSRGQRERMEKGRSGVGNYRRWLGKKEAAASLPSGWDPIRRIIVFRCGIRYKWKIFRVVQFSSRETRIWSAMNANVVVIYFRGLSFGWYAQSFDNFSSLFQLSSFG